MIKSELTTIDGEMACEVELGTVTDTQMLKEAEYELELSSIYDAFQKRFGFDTTISIMTNATKLFMAHQD